MTTGREDQCKRCNIANTGVIFPIHDPLSNIAITIIGFAVDVPRGTQLYIICKYISLDLVHS